MYSFNHFIVTFKKSFKRSKGNRTVFLIDYEIDDDAVMRLEYNQV